MKNEEAREFIVQSVKDDVDIAKVADAIQSLGQQPCEDCISREQAINELKLAYFNKDLQSAKDDPCIVDAMTDWAIRTIKRLPSVTPSYNSVKTELKPCGDCVSRESVGNMLNNIKMRGSEFWIDYYRKALDGLSQLPSVTPTISDVENNYNIGYNCGYADAMSDIADMRGDSE